MIDKSTPVVERTTLAQPPINSRYKLISAPDFAKLPAPDWRIKGVFPTTGLACVYGDSGAGKSFLCLDMAFAISTGSHWFDHPVKSAPVVYLALEASTGLVQRLNAWKQHRGQELPSTCQILDDDFDLTDPKGVDQLAAILPPDCVIFIDTLNRASGNADENSSKEMGAILRGAQCLQRSTNGLVVLIHHTGKNKGAGLRGHSSLHAALDSCMLIERHSNYHLWKMEKVKDEQVGKVYFFKLEALTFNLNNEEITSCTVVPTLAPAIQSTPPSKIGSNQAAVLGAIEQYLQDYAIDEDGNPKDNFGIQIVQAINIGSQVLTCSKDKRNHTSKKCVEQLISKGLLEMQNDLVMIKQ
jgi:putative DNA primase/helicase